MTIGIDDTIFDDPEGEWPGPRLEPYNEGMIPGMFVRVGKRLIGIGLSAETATRLAIQHNREVLGYGKTAAARFPEWHQVAVLAYGRSGRLVKTDEWLE
jgi:hypothetical protein